MKVLYHGCVTMLANEICFLHLELYDLPSQQHQHFAAAEYGLPSVPGGLRELTSFTIGIIGKMCKSE